MAGNDLSVTTAPARTSAPSVPGIEQMSGSLPDGKPASRSGESLPVPPPPESPVVDFAKVAEHLNEIMSSKQRSLRFQVDEASGRTIITVINAATQEVVRQIPSEELLAIARHVNDLGSFIDIRV